MTNIKHSLLFFEKGISKVDPQLDKFDRLVSPKTAAKLLDVSAKFIYECIARGDLEAERVGGRLRRIRLSALETWLRCQNQGS